MQAGVPALSVALAHHMAGRVMAAEAIYRQILEEDAQQPNALYLFGVLTLATGRIDTAIDLLERAARARPWHTEAQFALANARYRQGDHAAAITAYRAVLALQPDHGGAAINLARVLRETGDIPGALALLQNPGCAAEWSALAATLLAGNQDEAAVAAADQALALDPELGEAWFVRGTGLSRLRQFALALEALERAVATDPGHAEARLNLGNVLVDLDRYADAERAIREAIALDPRLVEAHVSLGFLLSCVGRLSEALAACDVAIALKPDFAQAHWNQAVCHLLAGEFGPGWEKYEWRKRQAFWGPFRAMAGTYWEGEDLAGRTLLVMAEQGLGDTIQIARYLPLLLGRGARVVLACVRPLHPLLACIDGLALAERDGELPPYDFWVDQMSLPRLFGTRIDNVPAPAGYLRADPALQARWHARLPPGRRIGLAWAGNPLHSNDRRRSMAFSRLAPILALPDTHFVSLQVCARSADAAGSAVLDLSAELTDYGQTAAVVANLDLVITVDTSVCHLAGALGVETWVMLPFAPEYRWMIERTDTPWYSRMRLFRQARPGDWDGVITEVAAAARGWAPSVRTQP